MAVIDFETDPFLYGRKPAPFVAGFYSVEIGYREFWGDDCVNMLLTFLETLDVSHYIYAHNGGKFDYLFFVDRLENPLKLINGRIAKAGFGIHEFRDSYSIIPVALGVYKKDDIDYSKFERGCRDKHRTEIGLYLKSDCLYLHELVSAFVERFGVNLTVGGTAVKELEKITPIERTGEAFDTVFRPFYYGGRVECFKTGIFDSAFTVIDVNSMYPYVMREYDHPSGEQYEMVINPQIDSEGELIGYEGETYFAVIEADNIGALPFRGKTALEFNHQSGTFHATSHEIKTALRFGKIKIRKVLSAFTFFDSISFVDYVDKFSAEKIDAKKSGDKVAELFAKFMLNSLYGKFGSNPENYADYYIQKPGDDAPDDAWTVHSIYDDVTIWEKPTVLKMFFNVATAASITGAARAVLFEAICKTESLYYCDTDSLIIAGNIPAIDIDASRLGAWKPEATGNRLAVAGKKMYALMDGSKCVKLASKGAKLTATDIFSLCEGNTVTWRSDAPNMKLNGDAKFVQRNMRRT